MAQQIKIPVEYKIEIRNLITHKIEYTECGLLWDEVQQELDRLPKDKSLRWETA